MKRIFIIFGFILIFLGAFAQVEFAPIGAKWYYNCEWGTIYIPGGEVIQSHFNHVISEKDTTIDGFNCRVLRQYYDISDTVDKEYVIKIDKGKVYYHYLDKYNLLFDFDAQINDTVLFTFMYRKYDYNTQSFKDTILSARYIVETIDTYTQNFREFTTKIVEEDMIVSYGVEILFRVYQYFEKIGHYDEFIPILYNLPKPLVDNHEWLRCYSDSVFYYVAEWWNPYSLPCDYFYSGNIGINSQKVEGNIKIYPNPFNDKVFVSTNKGGNITIVDISGMIIYISDLSAGVNEISTNHFPKGTYFAIFNDTNNRKQIYKIAKL